MINNISCQSLDYHKSLQLVGNDLEVWKERLRKFELFYLNESLLKLNKTYQYQNLNDFKREAKILINEAGKIGAFKFQNECTELCNLLDKKSKEEIIKVKFIQTINEAKLLQQDISNIAQTAKRDTQYDQYISVLNEQSTQKSETDQKLISEESCCKIF